MFSICCNDDQDDGLDPKHKLTFTLNRLGKIIGELVVLVGQALTGTLCWSTAWWRSRFDSNLHNVCKSFPVGSWKNLKARSMISNTTQHFELYCV